MRGVERVIGLAILVAPGTAWGSEVKINPKATYLRTSQDPDALGAGAESLASVGLTPGDWARIERTGFFVYANGTPDEGRLLGGIFSSSDALLGSDQLHRVPGAIAAGEPWVTGATFFGNLPTDIPEDFRIDNGEEASVVVRVPGGATHLFLTVPDSWYGDNKDPNGDFAANVSVVDCYADFTEDGALDLFDFLGFLNAFNAGGSRADCDGNRAWDLFDFLCFVNEFNAGC